MNFPLVAVIPIRNTHKVALIDTTDLELVSQYHTWHLLEHGLHGYAYARSRQGNVLMHRLILGLSRRDGQHVDHINGDGLNNRRYNLRLATPSQNLANRLRSRNAPTLYKGVYPSGLNKLGQQRYFAVCRGKRLGTFLSDVEAADAYNKRALKEWGRFARLNELPSSHQQAA